MQDIATLSGGVKHYDWGGTHYLPDLLQIENANLEPYAEYWMGVHAQAGCTLKLTDGATPLLRDYIAENPEKCLGNGIFKTFGNMPYLLKVLDVKDMLSIQVHPSKAQAALDFEAENKKGIPLTAPHRNYKDANHKPELMVAMSNFYLLHGFKPEAELLQLLDTVEELRLFKPVFKKKGYAGLYKLAMEMSQEQVNEVLQPLLNRIIPLYEKEQLEKNDERFWAARAALTFNRPGIIDRGIFSVFFFNLVQLKSREAIFQDAGIPHAYLEGYNVEIMASSDNVLRGGLTSKHIDTAELLKHTRCEAITPKVIRAVKRSSTQQYKSPVKDFSLTSYRLKKGDSLELEITTADIFLLMEGTVTLQTKKNRLEMGPGRITAVAFAGSKVKVKAQADSWLFKASARP
ncbi:mannose-6-phosphate isomerase [Niabella terrae]